VWLASRTPWTAAGGFYFCIDSIVDPLYHSFLPGGTVPTKLRDYKCNTCEHFFEHLSHGEEEEVLRCPKCNSLDIEIIFSTPLVTKLHEPEALKAALKKRSADDTLRQVRGHAGHKGTLPKDFGRKRLH
jgi:putative FmdB family regulatory protein